jgi:hypothetical protein
MDSIGVWFKIIGKADKFATVEISPNATMQLLDVFPATLEIIPSIYAGD